MVGLGVALALGVFTMVSLLIIHQWWPLIFIDGSDTKLLKLSASLMVFVSFTSLGDSIQNSSGGECSEPGFPTRSCTNSIF